MQWSWLNTEYSIHQVQHHPKIDSLLLPGSLPLPACIPLPGGCCCTQLSTCPQLPVNQWIESQLPSRLPPNRPLPSTHSISLNHSLQEHLQTRSITTSQCISEFTQYQSPIASPTTLDHGLKVNLQTRSITASQRIFKLALSRPSCASLLSLNLGLKVHLQTRSITTSECISEFTRSWPPSASLSSLHLGLQVHLSTRSITASMYILDQRWRVYGDTGVTEVDWPTGSTYLGHPGVDRHHLIFISSGSTQWRGFPWPGSIISSHFPSGASLCALNGRLQILLWLCSTTICGQIDCMYIYTDTNIMHPIFGGSESCDCNKD